MTLRVAAGVVAPAIGLVGDVEEDFGAGRFRLVLDMSDVDYISSGFLRVLMATQKEVKRFNRGDIYLAAPSQRIQDVLKLAGLDAMFKTFATPEEAVGAW